MWITLERYVNERLRLVDENSFDETLALEHDLEHCLERIHDARIHSIQEITYYPDYDSNIPDLIHLLNVMGYYTRCRDQAIDVKGIL